MNRPETEYSSDTPAINSGFVRKSSGLSVRKRALRPRKLKSNAHEKGDLVVFVQAVEP